MDHNWCTRQHILHSLNHPIFLNFITLSFISFFFFFFNDTATTEIYTLSLHDALPIYQQTRSGEGEDRGLGVFNSWKLGARSEEHTSELQSHSDLVCRLLLEKKKNKQRFKNIKGST